MGGACSSAKMVCDIAHQAGSSETLGVVSPTTRAQSTDNRNQAGSSEPAHANPMTDNQPTEQRGSPWSQLFVGIDTDKDGKVSRDDLHAATPDSELLLARKGKLRELMEITTADHSRKLQLPEFAEAMEEHFEMHYLQFYQSVNLAGLMAAYTMKHLSGADHSIPLLRDECLHMHPFQSLKSRPREQRVEIVRQILRSAQQELAEKIADGFLSAAEYEVQEGSGHGKFGSMLLGQVPLFDTGLEGMMGLADFKFQEAVEKEHGSEVTFKAWNNDIERETSPREQWVKVLPAGWSGRINSCDYHGQQMCDDFERHPMALSAGLEKVELVVLRLYTGPMFVLYNGLLRAYLREITLLVDPAAQLTPAEVKAAVEEARRVVGRGYATTVLVLASALQKLRTVSPLPPSRCVYRGMAGREVPGCFKREDALGNRGGVEFGFLSTSTSKQQAMGYINFSKGMPLLFEMEVGQIDRGASVSWISYFPAEQEVLLPPLSSLEALGDPRFEEVEAKTTAPDGSDALKRCKVMVWRVRLNVNLKAKTLAEMREVRRGLHTQMADNALGEVEQVLAAATADAQGCSAEELRVVELLREQCGAVVAEHKRRDAASFNDDVAYSRAVSQVLQLTPLATALLTLSASFGSSVVALLEASASAVPELVRSPEHDDSPSSPPSSSSSSSAVAKAALRLCQTQQLLTAHPEERDAQNRPPLLRCVAGNRRAEAELVLLAGARADAVDAATGKSVLRTAVEGKKREMVELLLQKGARDLHSAALLDDAAMARACVAAGVPVDEEDRSGLTALFVAVERGHHAVLRALLEGGASLDRRCGSGGYGKKTVLCAAAEKGDAAAVSLLLEHGADASVGAGADEVPPLWIAAEKNKVQALRALVQARADVRATPAKGAAAGKPALVAAAEKGNREAVAVLLEGGAAPDLRAAALLGDAAMARACLAQQHPTAATLLDGSAPVHLAVQQQSSAVLAALVEARADLNCVDAQGKTPLRLAAERGDAQAAGALVQGGAVAELHSAAMLDDAAMARECLAAGAEVDAVDGVTKRTAVHAAAAQRSVQVLQLLLERGAAVGVNALNVAALQGHAEVVALLVAAGVDPREGDALGRSAAHWCAEGGHVQCAETLERSSVGWDGPDNRGWTPLDIAYYHKKEAIGRWLEARGVSARFKARPSAWKS